MALWGFVNSSGGLHYSPMSFASESGNGLQSDQGGCHQEQEVSVVYVGCGAGCPSGVGKKIGSGVEWEWNRECFLLTGVDYAREWSGFLR